MVIADCPRLGSLESVPELDVRMLRMLVAVADEAVMGRAAERLHVSQPALSKQLAQLERSTGLTLFDRHAKGMTATPAGQVLVDHARAVLREMDAFSAAVERTRRELTGTLRLGYIAQTLNEKTRGVVHRFEQEHAGVAIEKRQYDLRDMTAGLLNDETDVALLRQPIAASELAHEPIFTEERVVILSGRHPVAAEATTTLAALFDSPWVVNATSDRAFRDFQLAIAQRGGRSPTLGPVVRTTDEFLEAVVSEQGIGLAPASAARYYSRPGVVYVPVTDAEPSICSVSWCRGRTLSPSASALLDLFRSLAPL
jgi:DNA-binding transcriptional LysR family regulator